MTAVFHCGMDLGFTGKSKLGWGKKPSGAKMGNNLLGDLICQKITQPDQDRVFEKGKHGGSTELKCRIRFGPRCTLGAWISRQRVINEWFDFGELRRWRLPIPTKLSC